MICKCKNDELASNYILTEKFEALELTEVFVIVNLAG